MKTLISVFLLLFIHMVAFAQTEIRISDDITVTKLSDKVYLYVSVAEIGGWGKVPSNGVIVLDNHQAGLLDTPIDDAQTKTLVNWITNSLKAKVVVFVPNHWHDDCLGGLVYLQKQGIKSYANQMTIDLARKNGKPVPDYGFSDSLTVKVGNTEIECYYLGGGHSTDNIVAWIPSEKILFGGCMIKDNGSTHIGNIADADMEAWPQTIDKVMKKFLSARYIIPGHGRYGGLELLEHTKELLRHHH